MTARNCPVQAAVCRDDDCRDACELMPAPERPGGWVEGIGWVALSSDLASGDDNVATWPEEPGVLGSRFVSPVIVTCWGDGSPPQAPTGDSGDLGPWCCYAGEVDAPTSECSPENPIHAPTHCGYDNVRRGLVPAPTVDSVPPNPDTDGRRDKLEIDVEVLLIDHCGMGGTSGLTDRILALTDAYAATTPAPVTPPAEDERHDFLPVAGHPDDDECTYRGPTGSDDWYCGLPEEAHPAILAPPPAPTPPETVPVPRAEWQALVDLVAMWRGGRCKNGRVRYAAVVLVEAAAAGVSGE